MNKPAHAHIQTTVKPATAAWIKREAAHAGLSVAAFVRVTLTRAHVAAKAKKS